MDTKTDKTKKANKKTDKAQDKKINPIDVLFSAFSDMTKNLYATGIYNISSTRAKILDIIKGGQGKFWYSPNTIGYQVFAIGQGHKDSMGKHQKDNLLAHIPASVRCNKKGALTLAKKYNLDKDKDYFLGVYSKKYQYHKDTHQPLDTQNSAVLLQSLIDNKASATDIHKILFTI